MQKRLLRFGMISDNHLDAAKPEMLERSRAAFELFKSHQTDLVVDSGDITDTFQPDQLAKLNRLWLEIFPDESARPERLWILAGHDVLNEEDKQKAYFRAAEALGIDELNFCRKYAGFTFIGMTFCEDMELVRKMLTDAAAEESSKPIFLITHFPAYRTMYGSHSALGEAELRNVLNDFPRVIHLSGHSHTPIANDNTLWQGEFTAVNAGSLYYWKDDTFGRNSRRHESADALICDLYADKLEIRRYNVLTQEEIAPDCRWQIPLPFDPASAPWNPDRRRKEFPVPDFPAAGEMRISFDKEPFVEGTLSIPDALPLSACQRYRVTLFEEGKEIAVLDYFNDLNERTPGQQGHDIVFPIGMLRGNTRYRTQIVPMNVYGSAGKAVSFEFSTPACALRQLPVSGTVSLEDYFTGEKLLPESGRLSFQFDGLPQYRRIRLSPEIENFRKGNLAVVFDFSCEHRDVPSVIMACGKRPDWGRHFFPWGKVGVQRHCFELNNAADPQDAIYLGEGSPGSCTMENVTYWTW